MLILLDFVKFVDFLLFFIFEGVTGAQVTTRRVVHGAPMSLQAEFSVRPSSLMSQMTLEILPGRNLGPTRYYGPGPGTPPGRPGGGGGGGGGNDEDVGDDEDGDDQDRGEEPADYRTYAEVAADQQENTRRQPFLTRRGSPRPATISSDSSLGSPQLNSSLERSLDNVMLSAADLEVLDGNVEIFNGLPSGMLAEDVNGLIAPAHPSFTREGPIAGSSLGADEARNAEAHIQSIWAKNKELITRESCTEQAAEIRAAWARAGLRPDILQRTCEDLLEAATEVRAGPSSPKKPPTSPVSPRRLLACPRRPISSYGSSHGSPSSTKGKSKGKGGPGKSSKNTAKKMRRDCSAERGRHSTPAESVSGIQCRRLHHHGLRCRCSGGDSGCGSEGSISPVLSPVGEAEATQVKEEIHTVANSSDEEKENGNSG